MKTVNDVVCLTASDLIGHLNCAHLTELDIKAMRGDLKKPIRSDPLLDLLRERGRRHEHAFLDHLDGQGLSIARIEGAEVSDHALAETRDAMQRGADIIAQAALQEGRWSGRADILRRVEKPSALGAWSYDVIDTKLARETKGGSVLQLLLYADLLQRCQSVACDYVHIVRPWSDFALQSFRVADYGSYFRKAKVAAEAATAGAASGASYPDPKDHCDVCRWVVDCNTRRRADDHLCLVAGISKVQICELQDHGITTIAALSEQREQFPWKVRRGSLAAYQKIREQARLQIETRLSGKPVHELLPVVHDAGFCILPEPSFGDVFFDLEGDPFVGEHGLEYLFGYCYRDEPGQSNYVGDWAMDRTSEKQCFERFIDFVIDRQRSYPDLHVYHYAPYEPAALKRLMGRYASRETELDELLRGKVFVDLYSVVRNAVRAGVESYSIKRLEVFFGYQRVKDLRDANVALARLQAALELEDGPSVTDADKDAVQIYNRDDCVATEQLRDWLEKLRGQKIAAGSLIPRPTTGDSAASDKVTNRQIKVDEIAGRLTAGITAEPKARSHVENARLLLANLLDWHRREDKAVWWEYFRLSALTADELIDERAALGQLEFVADVTPAGGRSAVHRYRFPEQDTEVRVGDSVRTIGGENAGEVASVSAADRTVDLKKPKKLSSTHPTGVFVHAVFGSEEQAASLVRIGEYVVGNGIDEGADYAAARTLLLRRPPSLDGESIRLPGEATLQAAKRLAGILGSGFLAIQGPPGTGKSHTAAHMICELVKRGKKVGITANSHKVIRNLIDKVIEAADKANLDLQCGQKPKEKQHDLPRLSFLMQNADVIDAIGSRRCQVVGATSFFWSRADAHNVVDVLVVDEAAQISLTNVVAVSAAAPTLILLGDPQQLDQPTQGTHPDGAEVSSLEHVLDGDDTISPDLGLFLEETWRLHPSICSFNSELFYDNKLHGVERCARQRIDSDAIVRGSGLRYLPVQHSGNKSSSPEEAAAIEKLVNSMLSRGATWTDRDGRQADLTLNDILIITPYNAQVFEIQSRLPTARVGTVDKFQGQEAPIAIYSMATSTWADAPRGMEFLYSANRFNVAISRAKCLAILVASPDIFEAECHTPRQMQLANAFCRFLELAETLC